MYPPNLVYHKVGRDVGKCILNFACLDFRKFVILGLFTKSRIRELSISMIGRDHNNNFSRDTLIHEFVSY